MRWAEHIARKGEMRNEHKILVINLRRRDRWENLSVDGRIKLNWIINSLRIQSNGVFFKMGSSFFFGQLGNINSEDPCNIS
jgi:hypothetical protein